MNIAEDLFTDPDKKQEFIDIINSTVVFGPIICISINILLGILYFILAVFIDSRLQNKFRT
jgi:hypothetical protein